VVRKGNYLAVVCEREEQAIAGRATAQGDLAEAGDGAVPGSEDLFTYMRSATPTVSNQPNVAGDPAALSRAAKVGRKPEYEVPFPGATRHFGPAHGMADPSNDQLTIYSNDMKSYGCERASRSPQHPRDSRPRRLDGRAAGRTGRTAATMPASSGVSRRKEIGRPVRVQWMRDEGTRWDTRAPRSW
jgi:hypothetical protein